MQGLLQSHGLFYLSFNEFTEYFDEFYLVHTNLNAYYGPNINNPSIKWVTKNFYGCWDSEKQTAGGCGKQDRTEYWTNPKYLIKIPSSMVAYKTIPFIISLTQMDQIRKRLEADGRMSRSRSTCIKLFIKIFRRLISPRRLQSREEKSTGI